MSDPPINLDELRLRAAGECCSHRWPRVLAREVLALVEAVEAAQALYDEAASSWDEEDIYEGNSYAQQGGLIRGGTLYRARAALARFAPPRAQEGDETP